MAYCVHCGVELPPGQPCCPLCGVESHDPLSEPAQRTLSYPLAEGSQLKGSARRAAGIVAALILLIPFLTVLASDLTLNGGFTWSRFVVVFAPLIYALVLPGLVLRRHKAMATMLFAWPACTLTLHLLSLATGGGWFLPFALPVSAALFVILLGLLFTCSHLSGRPLAVAGGMFLSVGLFVLLLEAQLNRCFFPDNSLTWSFYSLIPCTVIGVILFIIDGSPALKRALHRRLFI